MSEDKEQQNEQITQAGAVELDETNLDDASAGSADFVGVKIGPVSWKLDAAGNKFDAGEVGKKAF